MLDRVSAPVLSRASEKWAAPLSVALFAAIAITDWRTGYELSLNPFYLIVTMFVTWHSGWRWGVLFTLMSAANQAAIGLVLGNPYSEPVYFVVTNLSKLFSSLVIVMLIARVRFMHEREKSCARIDFLTGALNNLGFCEALTREMAQHQRNGVEFTLGYFDCDNFKIVNDLMGHKLGDMLLKLAVETLRHNLRKTDLIARLGGDEFAVLLPKTAMPTARKVIQKIHYKLNEAMACHHYPVTFSIGVGVFSSSAQTQDEVLALTDALMYRAKASGKNRVEYQEFQELRLSYANSCAGPAYRSRNTVH